VLDAQWFGVAQRRRRVFVIGYLGDWRRAAEVLFESESVRRNPAPSRKTGQGIAAHVEGGVADVCPTLGCELTKQVNNQMVNNAEAFYHAVAQPITQFGDIAGSLTARHDSSPCADRGANVVTQPSMQVRRLTPVECERLQGFPDNYTNIPWRKRTESPDGPRYKALGNSFAVPVVRWIGERIQMTEDLLNAKND